MTDDMITVALRVILAVATGVGVLCVHALYKRSKDHNPYPWGFLATGLALYSLAVWGLVLGSELTVSDWYRPLFSTLNLWVVCGSVWTLRKAVNHGW